MVLDTYIKEIIKVRGSVIVPGLGTFKSKYKPAEVNISRKSFSPPSKQIFFDDKITEDYNDVFINYICEKSDTGKLEVKELVARFVAGAKEKLDNNGQVPVSNLGYLCKDKAYKIHFIEEPEENVLLDAFGLSSFHLEGEDITELPLEKVEEGPKPEENLPFELAETSRNFDYKKIILPIVVLLVVVGLIILLMVKKTERANPVNDSRIVLSTDKSENVGTNSVESPQKQKNKTKIELKIDSITRIENALAINQDKYARYNKFYLVVGSFSYYDNAVKLRDEMERRGYDTEILNVENKIFRVTIKSFTDRQKALEELKIARSRMPEYSVWLLSVI